MVFETPCFGQSESSYLLFFLLLLVLFHFQEKTTRESSVLASYFRLFSTCLCDALAIFITAVVLHSQAGSEDSRASMFRV